MTTGHVITSYSIHYTKLYDTRQLRTYGNKGPVGLLPLQPQQGITPLKIGAGQGSPPSQLQLLVQTAQSVALRRFTPPARLGDQGLGIAPGIAERLFDLRVDFP